MDLDLDLDDNPYDFKAQIAKLLQEKNNKTLLKEDSKTDQPSTSQANVQKIISTEPTNSKINATGKDDCKQSDNTENSIQTRNKRKCPSTNDIGPIISIGDFDDEYNIPQFKPKPVTQIITIDDDDDDYDKITSKEVDDECTFDELNRIISVKVYWRKTRTYRFPIRMTIESIYEHFAKLENMNKSFVYLELNKMSLSPSDTPNSINYKITDFIDGDIVYYRGLDETLPCSETIESKKLIDDEINFRILQKNVKRPLTMSIKKTDKMQILYIKLSEKLGLDINSFILHFDGDKIKNSDTIKSLDLEGDECIELFKKN